MRIQHNIMAMNAYRNYNNNTSALSKNLEKLSSGYKINRAGDDAAGLAISEKMRAQITGLNAATKNVKDGISLVKTAEGAMQEIQDMLNRMDYLATQSANGTYDNEVDRLNLQKEVDALKTEINRIADSANFNGIKLLDGSLDRNYLTTEEGVTTETIDFATGIDFTTKAGGGSKGEYSFTLDTAFGAGDTITLDVGGTTVTATFNGTTTGATSATFTGSTAEEQAKSLQQALSSNATLAADFDVAVDGNKITITNKVEGDAATKITSIKANDKITTKDTSNWKETTAGVTATTAGKQTFKKLFDNQGSTTAGSLNVAAGDTLTFDFTINGKSYQAKLEVTDAMIANDAVTTTANIKTALENVKLEDTSATSASDESRMKVGDLFTITANGTDGGDLAFEGKGMAANVSAATVTTDRSTGAAILPITGTATAAAGAVSQVYTAKLDTTNGAGNYTAGDKLTFTGTLSDGRTFDVTLEAGKDFAIASTYNDTVTNIKNALENGTNIQGADINVTVKGGGRETQVKADSIFGTDGDFTVAATTGSLTLTSKTPGAAGDPGVASITNVALEAAPAASITEELKPGEKMTEAEATITFSDGLQYGATITIGDNTYELVASKDDLSSQRNTAVVVSDLTDTTAVASAVKKAIEDKAEKNDDGTSKYAVSTKDNVLTVKTTKIGSEVAATEVGTASEKSTLLEFTLDPERVQEKSYVTINGQDYQFVSDKNEVDAGKTAVVVDFKKATSKDLADALVNVASGKNNANVSADENGKITVRSIDMVDGEMPVPTASFHDGKGGLNLQIGDTAEDFNQMNVSIGDMHTSALGIDGVNIGKQEDARAAIDVIKDAINYVSGVRGDLGAIQNRLDHTANNLSVMAENIQDAESTIRDTDVAEEMMSYVKNNILVQSAQAMLAQANQVPQGVLQLLG